MLGIGNLLGQGAPDPFFALRNVAVSDTADFSESYTPLVTFFLSDVIQFSETVGGDYASVLSDIAQFAESLIRGTPVTAADIADFSESLGLGLALSPSDVADFNESVALGWAQTLADVVQFSESLLRNIPLTASDIINASDSADLDVGLVLADVADIAETLTEVRGVPLTLADQADLSDIAISAMSAYTVLSDGALFGGAMRIGDIEYNVWVVNTQTLGLSRYQGYNFNSIAGNLGARDDGVYLLEGDDDAGTEIDAYFETGLLDFGTAQRKTIPDVYLALTSDGNTMLKVTTSQDGSLVTDWYEVRAVYTGPDNTRYKPGKGLRARYWKFRLENVDGSDFDLSDAEVLPLILSRRL